MSQDDRNLSILIFTETNSSFEDKTWSSSKEYLEDLWIKSNIIPVPSNCLLSNNVNKKLQHEARFKKIPFILKSTIIITGDQVEIDSLLFHTVDFKLVSEIKSVGSLELGTDGKWNYIVRQLVAKLNNYPYVYPKVIKRVKPTVKKKIPLVKKITEEKYNWASFQASIGPGFNITRNSGIWKGLILQPSLSLEYTLSNNEGDNLSIYLDGGYTYEAYKLDENYYPLNLSLYTHNIFTGLGVKLRLPSDFYYSLGLSASWALKTIRQNDLSSITIDSNNYSVTFPIKLGAGYTLKPRDGFCIDIGLDILYTPFIKDSVPLVFLLTPKFRLKI